MLIIMSAYIGLDGLQTILSGILRGTGRQAYAAPVIGTACTPMVIGDAWCSIVACG